MKNGQKNDSKDAQKVASVLLGAPSCGGGSVSRPSDATPPGDPLYGDAVLQGEFVCASTQEWMARTTLDVHKLWPVEGFDTCR